MPRLSSADSRRRRRESELRRQAQALQHRAATQLPHTHDAKPAQDAMPPDSLRGLVVLSRRDLSPHARQRLLYLTQHIARPRPLLAQIMRCPPGSRRLENLISQDPACATQLRDYLKAMEIELNAGSEGIVRQAVAQLGSDWVTDIVIRNLIHQSIQVPDPETAQAIEERWWTGFTASSLAATLSRRFPELAAVDPPMARHALLLPLGEIMLLASFTELTPAFSGASTYANRIRTTQQKVGFNPALLGAALVQKWQIPEALVDTLANAHTPLTTPFSASGIKDGRRFTLAYICYRLAERIARTRSNDLNRAYATLQASDEYYYLKEYLHGSDLADLPGLLTTSEASCALRSLTDHFPARI
ncbi:MAG TPA: hypothetical protein DCZ13_06260 [Porticoccaceae bacterium]|nr:hypothetical protein [Porticoccaceae bacterium]